MTENKNVEREQIAKRRKEKEAKKIETGKKYKKRENPKMKKEKDFSSFAFSFCLMLHTLKFDLEFSSFFLRFISVFSQLGKGWKVLSIRSANRAGFET